MSKQRETLKECEALINYLAFFKKAYLSQVQALEKLEPNHHQEAGELKHLRALEDKILSFDMVAIKSSILISRF